MSAVTKHIESLLRENNNLNQTISDIVKNTQKEALLNGDNIYFHDEPPITKPSLRTKGPERYSETPYISIAEAGGQTTTLNVDNNRSIQILARIPEDYIEIVIREIQKTLDNTYNRTLPLGDLNYWYYGFNEIGQPIYLTKKNGVVLYSIKYSAGYTVAEPVKEVPEEEKEEFGENEWPRIIKTKYFIDFWGGSKTEKSTSYVIDFKDHKPLVNGINLFFVPALEGRKKVKSTGDTKFYKMHGNILFLKESDTGTDILSLKELADTFRRSNVLNIERMYVITGKFIPKRAKGNGKREDYNGRMLPEELEYEFTPGLMWRKVQPDYYWNVTNGPPWWHLYENSEETIILKTFFLKKDINEDLKYVLRGLESGNYYQLDGSEPSGRIKNFTPRIYYYKYNHFGNSSDFSSVGCYANDTISFNPLKDMIIREESDRFLIYITLKARIFSQYDLDVFSGQKTEGVFIEGGFYDRARTKLQNEKSGNMIVTKPGVDKEEDKFWIIDELKQKEGIVLPYEFC